MAKHKSGELRCPATALIKHNRDLLTGSGGSRLQKAQAESFIHIFVNNSAKLTEFLEHMISVSHIIFLAI